MFNHLFSYSKVTYPKMRVEVNGEKVKRTVIVLHDAVLKKDLKSVNSVGHPQVCKKGTKLGRVHILFDVGYFEAFDEYQIFFEGYFNKACIKNVKVLGRDGMFLHSI